MANWVLVENGQIQEYHGSLPKNWKNISGLDLLINDLSALKNLGWYPVTQDTVEITSDAEYYTIREEFQYRIQDNDVLEIRYVYREPYDPPAEIIDYYAKFLEELRLERNKRLADTDYTQLADIQSRLSDMQKNQINTYRQSLRDLPATCNTLGIFDINQVIWPEHVPIFIN